MYFSQPARSPAEGKRAIHFMPYAIRPASQGDFFGPEALAGKIVSEKKKNENLSRSGSGTALKPFSYTEIVIFGVKRSEAVHEPPLQGLRLKEIFPTQKDCRGPKSCFLTVFLFFRS